MQNLFEQEATTCREVGEKIARIKKLENNLLSFSNFYEYFIWAKCKDRTEDHFEIGLFWYFEFRSN